MTGTRLPAVVKRAACSSCRLAGAQLPIRERSRTLLNPVPSTSALFSTSARKSASTSDSKPSFKAAPEIDLEDTSELGGQGFADRRPRSTIPMDKLRVVPASPSYFTSKPEFTDRLLELEAVLRKYTTLPTVPGSQTTRVAWKTVDTLRAETGEPRIRAKQFSRVKEILQRLNRINPELMPEEVTNVLQQYKRIVQPSENVRRPNWMDEFGRAAGAGRRKSSKAMAVLVEGDGQVLINGQTLTQAFDRLRDRESAVWALKVTERLTRYNVWVRVSGGGTTGQAEAITMAVGHALTVHEPSLKPTLRRGKLSLGSALFLALGHLLLTIPQRDASHVTVVGWRGRSQADSRLGRCPPGSSDRGGSLPSSLCVYLVSCTYRFRSRTARYLLYNTPVKNKFQDSWLPSV
jgi:small subunit ribosomal protein S9